MTDLGDRRVAVGWLHPDHLFPRGAAAPEFAARLAEFARHWGESVDVLDLGASGGFHECEFCNKEWGDRVFGKDLGSGKFGVPVGDRIYYCPEMIAHYVTEHGYLPPPEFVAAVMACPVPGTAEYRAVAGPFVIVDEES
jgi:hypothetical protein